MKRTGPTKESRRKLAIALEKKAKESKKKIWKSLAEEVKKAARHKKPINVWQINNIAKKQKGTLIKASKILSFGDIEAKAVVVAPEYSNKAKEKIEKAGGQLIMLEEFLKEKENKGEIILIK